MRLCTGVIGWAPVEFWSASLPEIWQAIEGLTEFHAGPTKQKDEPLSDEEIEELARKHPDKPRA